MKKIITINIITTIFFIGLNSAFAQKEYWGMFTITDTSFVKPYGAIYKTDSMGSNIQIVNFFDSINGMGPIGRLFLASDGKLYGTTGQGGAFTTPFITGGTLFQYDLATDSLSTLINFGTAQYPNGVHPSASFIEPSPGILYGIIQSDNGPSSIYKYNLSTHAITFIYSFPLIPYQLSNITNPSLNNLVAAANGKLYGTTLNGGSSGCSPTSGTIYSIDTANNSIATVYPFSCVTYNGIDPLGDLVEGLPGMLFGRTSFGGNNNEGVLFEYNYLTNTYTVKHHFDSLQGNLYVNTLTKATNNKLYGLTSGGGTDDVGNHLGTLYEFNPFTNTYTTKYNFGLNDDGQGGYILTGGGPFGNLLQASNGRLYGNNYYGVFEFNLMNDTLILRSVFPNPGNIAIPVIPAAGLIEICRKPSYKYFYTDTFIVCKNNSFTYTVHSNNANSYQWNKNGTGISAQADSILDFNNIQLSDSGIYTCTMQNQCGQTETMNLVVKVSLCTGIDEQFGMEHALSIVPNPTTNFFSLQIIDNGITQLKQVHIKNMLGQTMLQSKNSNTKFDISGLSKGIYLVEVQTNKGLWVGRVIKK